MLTGNQEYFYKRLGEFIKEARIKADVSQEALATILNLSRISIVNIEKGRQKVQIHTLIEIVNYLDIPIDNFFEKVKTALKLDISPKLEKEIIKRTDSDKSEDIIKLKEFITYTRITRTKKDK